jgi:cellulose synthase/poly-beta-1,6-N-acetylglucosamine synthase-like glycosyltransferase
MLAARGARVLFAPEAVVFDPKPAHASGASRQRARWLQGQLQVLRDYWREIRQALFTRGLGAWFLIFLLMLRPKTFFIGVRSVMLITTLSWGPWWLALTALMLDVTYYLAGVSIVDDRRRYLLDLLAAPRYVAMWLFSFGTAMVRRGWLKAGR